MSYRPTDQGPFYGISVLIIFTCSFTASQGSDQSAACVKYMIGGSRLQPHLSGFYELSRRTYNNRLVYTQSCSQYGLFLSKQDNHTYRWAVGKGVGDDVTTYVRSHDTRAYPRDVTSWEVWSRSRETWVREDDIFITCVETNVHRQCRSFIAEGPDVPEEYRGPYVTDGFHSNHVKYKHKDRLLYMFHKDDGVCKRWIIGPKLGENVVAMQSFTNNSSPFDIREKWMIAKSGYLLSDMYTVHIKCTEYDDDETSDVTCGRRPIKSGTVPYMFGAGTTYPGKWPFVVSYVRADGVHKCGATVIGRRWIITAGHCVSPSIAIREELRLGAYDLGNAREQHVQTIQIKAVHIHPLFSWVLDPFRLNYDVALLELSEDVIYTDNIQPACLPPQQEHFPFDEADPISSTSINNTYTNCHMVGWGKTDYIDMVGGKLQEVQITRVMTMSECYDVYYYDLAPVVRNLTSICLFGRSGGRMCKGDSGSPLFCERDGRWYLLGLGGWSVSQCVDMYFYYPSVYTDLSIFTDWVTAIIYGSY